MTVETAKTSTRKDNRDLWAKDDSEFITGEHRWGVAVDLSSRCVGPVDAGQDGTDAALRQQSGATVGATGTRTPLAPAVTDNLRQCGVCGGSFAGRADARTCGTRCRQRLRRRREMAAVS